MRKGGGLKMVEIESIILDCLKQLKCERTIYSIYHLLNGKKSSQTIQDAHLFSMKRYFGIYESLTRESFDEIIESLVDKKWIEYSDEQRYILTHLGTFILERASTLKYMNGWSYHLFTSKFWERLSLFVQVTSNLMYEEAHYLPIQKNKDVHIWLKTTLKEINVPRKELGNIVFSELFQCFQDAAGIDPSLVVFRLTGFRQIGLTPLQTAKKLNMDIHDYQVGFIHTLHYLLHTVSRNPKRYSILALLMKDFEQSNELTISARKTLNLLEQGFSLDQIANVRHLKESTIEDHLIEFALHIENFSIDSYVNQEMQKKIVDITQNAGTRQLKLIRDKYKDATYFQIRLVMAKYGDR